MKSSKDYDTQNGIKKNPIIAVFAFLASLVSSIYNWVNDKIFTKDTTRNTVYSNEDLYSNINPDDHYGAMAILFFHDIGLKTLKIDDEEINLEKIAEEIADIKDESGKINKIISLFGKYQCAVIGSQIGTECTSFIVRNFMKLDSDVGKSKEPNDIRMAIEGFAVVKNGDLPNHCNNSVSINYPASRFLVHDDGFLSKTTSDRTQFALLFDSVIQSPKHHYRFLQALDFLPYVKHKIYSTQAKGLSSDELYGSGYNFFPCSRLTSNNIISKQFLEGNGIENNDEGIRFKNGILDGFAKSGKDLFYPFMDDDDTKSALEEIYSIIGDNHHCIFSDTEELFKNLLRDFESNLNMINDTKFYNYLVDGENKDVDEFFNRISNGVLKEGKKFKKNTECKLSLSFHSPCIKEKVDLPEELMDGPDIINTSWAKANFVDLSEINALYKNHNNGSVIKIRDDRCDALDTYKIFLERTVTGLREMLNGRVVTKDEEPRLLNQLQKVLHSAAIGVDDAYYKAMMATLYMHCGIKHDEYNNFFSLIKGIINKNNYLLPSDSVSIENLSDVFTKVLQNVNTDDPALMKYGKKEVDAILDRCPNNRPRQRFQSFHNQPNTVDYICSGYITKVIGDPSYKESFSKHSKCLSDGYKALYTRSEDQETKRNIDNEVFSPSSIETVSPNQNIPTKGIM